MNKNELKELMIKIKEEIRIYGRPSLANGNKMFQLLNEAINNNYMLVVENTDLNVEKNCPKCLTNKFVNYFEKTNQHYCMKCNTIV